MYSDMNEGIHVGMDHSEPVQTMERTNFFLGAVVTNYKRYEREVMPQYFKLAKKIESGAAFIINQIGYDSRKQDELLKYMAQRGLDVPVIANVYVLSAAAARYFHADKIPGCVVTGELLALVERQSVSPDRGKAFFLEFAAKQCAIAKGLGFRGVYLGGHLKYEEYEQVLLMAARFGKDDWQDFAREIRFHQPGEFYSLNGPSDGFEFNGDQPGVCCLKDIGISPTLKASHPLSYKINRFVHDRSSKREAWVLRLGRRSRRQSSVPEKGFRKPCMAPNRR
jgi:methylenetetrahydrofolate reductase (NADPH)